MAEIYLYALPCFVLLSYTFYLLRTYKFTRTLALGTLFISIFAFILFIIQALDNQILNESVKNGVTVQTTFNGQAFIAQYIEEYPLVYLVICILLTSIFKESYFRLLNIEKSEG